MALKLCIYFPWFELRTLNCLLQVLGKTVVALLTGSMKLLHIRVLLIHSGNNHMSYSDEELGSPVRCSGMH